MGRWIFWGIIFSFICSMAIADEDYNRDDPNLKESRGTEAMLPGLEEPTQNTEDPSRLTEQARLIQRMQPNKKPSVSRQGVAK